MHTILIFLHVATAILFIGPVTVAVSLFGGQAVKARAGDARADGIATVLHGITRTYGWLSLLVPLFGIIMLIIDWDTYGTMWNFHTALLLAVIAWGILLFVIIPKQKKMVAGLAAADPTQPDAPTESVGDWEKAKSRLAMFGGIFNLLWIIMLILMYV